MAPERNLLRWMIVWQLHPIREVPFLQSPWWVCVSDLATSGSPSLTGSALRAMLPSALSVSQLSSDSVHYGIRLGSDYQQGAAIFTAVSPTPRRGGPSSQLAHSPCARDPKRSDRGRPSCHFRVLAVVPGLPPFL